MDWAALFLSDAIIAITKHVFNEIHFGGEFEHVLIINFDTLTEFVVMCKGVVSFFASAR